MENFASVWILLYTTIVTYLANNVIVGIVINTVIGRFLFWHNVTPTWKILKVKSHIRG